MESKNQRIERLRERRIKLAAEQERANKRRQFGPSVVNTVNLTLRGGRTLNDFDANRSLAIEFLRSANLQECRGLVAAYVSESRIGQIVACCEKTIGPNAGLIGFDEYEFMGTLYTSHVKLESLLALSKSLHDTVFFNPEGHKGAILLDYHHASGMTPGYEYSIVIQGEELETKLSSCFNLT